MMTDGDYDGVDDDNVSRHGRMIVMLQKVLRSFWNSWGKMEIGEFKKMVLEKLEFKKKI